MDNNIDIKLNTRIILKYNDFEKIFYIRKALRKYLCSKCKEKIDFNQAIGIHKRIHFCLNCCKKYYIRTLTKDELIKRKIIKCQYCGKMAKQHAFYLCSFCYSKQYRKKYPDRIKAQWQKYKKNHTQSLKESRKKYASKEETKQRKLEWAKLNRKKIREIYTPKINDKRRFSGNREKVLIRDKYKCQICGEKNKLHIHHKKGDGFQNSRFKIKADNSLENLITLCNGCHRLLHSHISFKNILEKRNLNLSQFWSDINQDTGEDTI